MRNGAGAPKDLGKPRPPAAANNLGNDITTSRQENGQAQSVPRLLCSDPAGGDPDAVAGGGPWEQPKGPLLGIGILWVEDLGTGRIQLRDLIIDSIL